MKTTFLSLIALVSSAAPSFSQVTLNQGDTYVFEFTSVPFARVEPGVFGVGFFQFEMTGFVLGNDRIRWELFENSTADTPFLTASLPPGGVAPGYSRSEVVNSWVADHQGAVRFTMEFGSATLSQITINVSGPLDAGSHNVFEMTVVPVPEPGVVGILGPAMLGLWVWRFIRGRRSTAA